MHFYAISGLLVAISNFLMAVWVYIKGHNKKANKLWILFIIAASIWGFGSYKFTTSLDKKYVFLWLRIAYIGAIFIPTLFYHFVFTFLDIRRKKTIIALYLITILFTFFNFFNKSLFLGEPEIIFSSFYWVRAPGPIWFLFFIYFISLVIYSEYRLFKEYRISVSPRRNHIRYIFLATSIGFLSGTTCFLPCFGINLYPGIGNIGVALYCIVVAYAIVKYRLMDIRVVITRTSIFVVVYTLVLGIPYVWSVLSKNWLINNFGQNWWLGPPLVLLTILGTVGPFLYIYLQKRAEIIILRRQRTYQDTLKQAAREIARIHKLKRLLDLIVHMVTKTVGITSSAIYLFDEKSQTFNLRAARNIKKTDLPMSLTRTNAVIERLNNSKEILLYEEIAEKVYIGASHVFEEIEAQMKSLNAALIVPGMLKDDLLGFLILGAKRSGEFYTPQDIDTLSVIAHQAALAIENALLYENMERQIQERTDALVITQKQLVQAEKLATMGTLAGGVAHEINNPLTAILTNAQMLLSSKKIDDELDRESLELIEEATKRCRTIVQKLMAYAKRPLESANFARVNIAEVIKKALSFIEFQLGQENIKLIIESKDTGYMVLGDHNELEQVVTNIILNGRDAINQAGRNNGEIKISLSKNNEWVKVRIADNGIGIPKESLPKIFDPFFTTKDIGKGLGLGLSICHSIIEKYKGLISVNSEPGKGTVFTLQFPIAQVSQAFIQ